MQTGGPSDERVTKMMEGWMMNASHFCVSPTGDMVGNDDKCYWGLPSIERSDTAFQKLGYWRGYVCESATAFISLSFDAFPRC